jgi:hypothetical protein
MRAKKYALHPFLLLSLLALRGLPACGGEGGQGPPGGSGISSTVPTSVCASGQKWSGGDHESELMHPGMDCIGCHSSGEGPTLLVAGTVYSSLHEGDDCYGLAGATVQITQAGGQVLSAMTNSAGNFLIRSRGALSTPFTAKIIVNGMEKAMLTPQATGDCMSCHTQMGLNAAPGRIAFP